MGQWRQTQNLKLQLAGALRYSHTHLEGLWALDQCQRTARWWHRCSGGAQQSVEVAGGGDEMGSSFQHQRFDATAMSVPLLTQQSPSLAHELGHGLHLSLVVFGSDVVQ